MDCSSVTETRLFSEGGASHVAPHGWGCQFLTPPSFQSCEIVRRIAAWLHTPQGKSTALRLLGGKPSWEGFMPEVVTNIWHLKRSNEPTLPSYQAKSVP